MRAIYINREIKSVVSEKKRKFNLYEIFAHIK